MALKHFLLNNSYIILRVFLHHVYFIRWEHMALQEATGENVNVILKNGLFIFAVDCLTNIPRMCMHNFAILQYKKEECTC